MSMVLEGLLNALTFYNMAFMIFGSFIGIIIGIMPGLGSIFALALIFPLTFGMPGDTALLFLSSLYASSIYAGGITSILINTPGTVGSITTCFDGYPLARQGKSGEALGAMTIGALIGGTTGVIALVLLAKPLTSLSLKVGPAEYFWLAVFGISMVSIISKGDTMRGILIACMGLLASTVGLDIMTGNVRFDFGIAYLIDGIYFPVVVIGMFALSQAIFLAKEGGSISNAQVLSGGFIPGVKAALKYPLTIIRSALIGTFIGIIPGIGVSTSNLVAYTTEKRLAKDSETFGKGNIKGVIAPETANNGTVIGELIPTITLGIPGGAAAALFLGAMIMHGIQPGLGFLQGSGSLAYTIFWGLFISQVLFSLLGWFGARYFVKITQVPNAYLVPLIVIISVIGAYSLHRNMGDVVLMGISGLLGYIMLKYKYPIGSFIIGMVLGPIAESNFHRSLMIGDGSISIFFKSSISWGIIAIILLTVLGPTIMGLFNRKGNTGKAI